MKGLAGLIAALGAGMGGYAKGNAIYNDEQRAKAREAREEDQYQRTVRQQDKADRLERDLADSQKDISPEIVTNAGTTYADPELMAADNREFRRAADQTGTAVAPLAPAGYRANGQTFADQAGAQQALAGVNSQSAKMDRAAKVYGQAGQLDKQRQFMQFAQDAVNEGTDKILSSLQSAAPSVEELKKAKGTKDATVGDDAADIFNKTGGKWKVKGDTKVQYFLEKDAAGREVVNFRVYGKDGVPVIENGRGASLMLADLKTRLQQQNQETQTFQTAQQMEEQRRHNQKTEANAASSLGIQQKSLDLRKQEMEANTPAGKLLATEKAIGRKLTDDERMTALGVDKFSSVDRKRIDSLVKDQERILTAQAKAMAEGTWQPESEGAKALTAQAAAVSLKLNKVMAKYEGGGKSADADPLGLFADTREAAPAKPGGKAGEAKAPASQEEQVRLANVYGNAAANSARQARQGVAALGPQGAVTKEQLAAALAALQERDRPLRAAVGTAFDTMGNPPIGIRIPNQ
jgi:hypothetical protein